VRTGVVTAFDERRGIGAIATEAGEEFLLHCTAIADGTRRIAVGTAVRFAVAPGRQGRWEATAVVPRGSLPPASG
jgi:cold shock CspA family protein